MNKTFAFPRFWNYFKYDLARFWRMNWVMVLTVGFFSYIAISILLSRIPIIGEPAAIRSVRLIISLFLFGLCHAWTYRQLRRPTAGTAFVLLPASTLEKYISMLIVILLITPLAYSLLLLASDALYSWIAGQQNMIGLTNELVGLLKDEADIGEMKLGLFVLSSPIAIYTIFSLLSLLLGTFSKHSERILLVLAFLFVAYLLGKVWPRNGEMMQDLSKSLAQSTTTFVLLLAALWFRLKTIRY